MANQCEIWSAIEILIGHSECVQITIRYYSVPNELLLKIGRHKWPNGYMFHWPILRFGGKMAEG